MSIFEYISYGEFVKLVVCVSLDVVEYLIPSLLTPFVGDIFDVVGLATSLYMFKWIGLFSVLELVPGLDILPINIITWLIWILSKRGKGFADSRKWES
ncbi:MAG: hypothetical protein QG670_1996 [Thermoproteota archaeon]|nr:hypothetical protein [Thermoproteota archaeon]